LVTKARKSKTFINTLEYIPYEHWDSIGIAKYLTALADTSQSNLSDHKSACDCKKELYLLKCLIEDLLVKCPNFGQEQEWEHQRLIDLLKEE